VLVNVAKDDGKLVAHWRYGSASAEQTLKPYASIVKVGLRSISAQ
jgi:hypothetical protein